MLVSDALIEVRRQLSDTGSSPRWSSTVLKGYLTTAGLWVVRTRPDMLLSDTLIMATTPFQDEDGVQLDSLSSDTDTIELPSDGTHALLLMASSYALQEDSDDRTNWERADLYNKEAYVILTGSTVR
jgi:hypothetical protein